MASMKEKYGNKKKSKQQVHFSDSDSDSGSDKKSNKKDIPTCLSILIYLINLKLWNLQCTKGKMSLGIVPKILSK
jgi:hypothetical protein